MGRLSEPDTVVGNLVDPALAFDGERGGRADMGHVNTTKETEVEQNRQAFEIQLPAIMADHAGEYALLHQREIIGYFADAMEAEIAGNQNYPDDAFSIQMVTQETAGLGYLSYVLCSR